MTDFRADEAVDRHFGARNRVGEAIDLNRVVSDFAVSQRAAAALVSRASQASKLNLIDELSFECTCDRDPLGVCPHCGCYPGPATWNEVLKDCLRELAESNPEPLETTIADFEAGMRAAQASRVIR